MDRFDSNDGSIVSISNANARHPFSAIRAVEAYWESLRDGRVVPARSDVDPRGVENALEYAFVVERIATGIGRIRIAGSHLNDLMGMEVRGMPLSTFFTPDARRTLPDLLEEVFQAPAVCEMTLQGETAMGKPPMEGRLILLPLRSDLGDCSRILGCLVSHGVMGRTPRRFDISGHRCRQLSNTPTSWPQDATSGTTERVIWQEPSSRPNQPTPLVQTRDKTNPVPRPVIERGHLKLFSFKD